MLAATPEAIGLAFRLLTGLASKQVMDPETEELQKSVFPATVAAEPTVSPITEYWLDGKLSVNSKPAGVVSEAVRVTLRAAVPPGPAVADDTLRLVV